jgi:SAM-dependent methyltransferase
LDAAPFGLNAEKGDHLLLSGKTESTEPRQTTAARSIEYLSLPAPVNMGDWWFDIATSGHFWIRRRFEVMRRLADSTIRTARHVAEIGCGNGLLQKDVEDYYGVPVAGFELNELALQKNVSRVSPLYCYDIHQRAPQFRSHFDLLFLFDVLEHIEDESGFLQSVKFHLVDSGTLLVNVPALEFFRSDYDRAAGHVRRYSASQLREVLERNGFKVKGSTYWGLPLVPLLLVRKAITLPGSDGKSGFDSRGVRTNDLLGLLARMEPIPQSLLGTSVMMLAESTQ